MGGWMLCLVLAALPLIESATLIVPQAPLIEIRHLLDEDEVHVIERLIQSTEERLEQQRELRDCMLTFQKDREIFTQGKQTKEQATLLVKEARQQNIDIEAISGPSSIISVIMLSGFSQEGFAFLGYLICIPDFTPRGISILSNSEEPSCNSKLIVRF